MSGPTQNSDTTIGCGRPIRNGWAETILTLHVNSNGAILIALNKKREIEARLRQAVEEARARYESAKQKHNRALEHREDLGVMHPDGGVSLRQATSALRIATMEYNRALLAYGFILRGRLPEPEAPATHIASRSTPALPDPGGTIK